jgi:hypothetical protein
VAVAVGHVDARACWHLFCAGNGRRKKRRGRPSGRASVPLRLPSVIRSANQDIMVLSAFSASPPPTPSMHRACADGCDRASTLCAGVVEGAQLACWRLPIYAVHHPPSGFASRVWRWDLGEGAARACAPQHGGAWARGHTQHEPRRPHRSHRVDDGPEPGARVAIGLPQLAGVDEWPERRRGAAAAGHAEAREGVCDTHTHIRREREKREGGRDQTRGRGRQIRFWALMA